MVSILTLRRTLTHFRCVHVLRKVQQNMYEIFVLQDLPPEFNYFDVGLRLKRHISNTCSLPSIAHLCQTHIHVLIIFDLDI